MKINKITTKTLVSRGVSSRFNVSKELWEVLKENATPIPTTKEYALLASQYDYAELSSEVTLPSGGVISFDMFCDLNDSSSNNIAEGTGTSQLYYRGSDGRFRLISDQGNIFNFSIPSIFDGGVHRIIISLTASGADLYVDGNFYGSAGSSNTDTFSILYIGEGVSVFNFTIGNIASYPMLTYDTSSVNTSDEIGDNNLTYVNLLPLTEDSYREVSNDY